MDNEHVAMLISCFDWYEARLKYIENHLQSIGFDVLIVMSDYNHITKQKDRHLSEKKNIKYISPPEYKKNVSTKRIWSHYNFAKQIGRIVERIKPELVYVLVPPNYLLEEIRKTKAKYQYKLVVDIIDLWPESFPYGNMNFYPFLVWKSLRDSNINLADKIVLECNFYKKKLPINIPDVKLHTLYLTSKPLDHTLVEMQRLHNSSIRTTIRLGYLGSINSLIDIERICWVVRILGTIKPVEVRIVGCGENTKELMLKLKKSNAKIRYYGAIYDDAEKYKIFECCDYGLNIYKNNVTIGLTIKSIDYFKYGLPILNTIKGDTEYIVNKYNCGININSLSEIEFIDKFQHFKPDLADIRNMFDELFNEDKIDSRLQFLDEVCK